MWWLSRAPKGSCTPWATERDFRDIPHAFAQSVHKNQGRIEIRQGWALSDERAFESMRHYDGWAGLRTVVMVKRERRARDNILISSETAYFLSSLPANADVLLYAALVD